MLVQSEEGNFPSLNTCLPPDLGIKLGVKMWLLTGRTGPKEGAARESGEQFISLELPAPLDE